MHGSAQPRRLGLVGTAVALLLGLLNTPPALALKFKVIREGEALVVYDCGSLGLQNETKDSCAPHERRFSGPANYSDGTSYVGDAQALEKMLLSRTFRHVLLASGGGDLDEGVKVGEMLRRFNTYVIVPKGAQCVSACTVAFLGGRIREVEPGASYQVHAYSGLVRAKTEFLDRFTAGESESALDNFVKRSAGSGRAWARRLLTYVQKMIGGSPSLHAMESLEATLPDFQAIYMSSGLLKTDLERMRTEGQAVTQEILMRIERQAFETALTHYKRNQELLGARAGHAIRILEIMFSSRISYQTTLDADTLQEMGYTNVRK